ncbi:ATP-dependent helicase [Enterococcus sp. JM9B]|uniref:ATP-dependent helicase n=1 Tax=Enterococcus sp. JM9B TaxID=1857216 RepID=UPI0013751179|nr:ATP-dependent helicase [Enterococcus sp. JM9B]KAF1304204.1 DNA helicase [Enterococcus sp. JM9B]
MDIQIEEITSNTFLPIDKHLKISAGPGAGKTTLLANHIQNIIRNSSKISELRKVGCITYTNIAVETLKKRLGIATDYAEIGTIHNFFFKHIVKPYLWILSDEYVFDFERISGHDDIVPTYSVVQEWITSTKSGYLTNASSLSEISGRLQKILWKLDDKGVPYLGFPNLWQGKIGKYFIKKESLFEYKKICWAKGLIHHDDVMFFSLKIIEKNKRIVDIIRAKFPYIMIDEFQDTSLIQSKIIKKIAERETIVGVIGDECQSIYKFAGAEVDEFIDFNLKGAKHFKIRGNNRSTTEIINVLNHISRDAKLNQFSPKKIRGDKPSLIVGSMQSAFQHAKSIAGEDPLLTLAYRKDDPSKLKHGVDNLNNEDLKLSLLFDDGDRGRKIYFVIQSVEYAKDGRIQDAMKSMSKAYRKDKKFEDCDSLKNLQSLLSSYPNYENLSITDFYNTYIFGKFYTKQKISRGKMRDFYSEIVYKDIASIVDLDDTGSLFRTIHKSKGDEEESVLLIIENSDNFNEDKDLKFILSPSIKENEDHRVYFVALSRAKKKLFINIPSLSEQSKQRIDSMNLFKIVYL